MAVQPLRNIRQIEQPHVADLDDRHSVIFGPCQDRSLVNVQYISKCCGCSEPSSRNLNHIIHCRQLIPPLELPYFCIYTDFVRFLPIYA
jgi:hypothetical protein